MGFRICFIATNVSLGIIEETLHLECIQTVDEHPDVDHALWSAQLENGFQILWSENELFGFENEKRLIRLSRKGLVYYAIANETVGASTLWGYENGAKVFDLHWQGDGEATPDCLTAEGSKIPTQFHEVKDLVEREPPEDDFGPDYFEVPVETGVALFGFRYDRQIETGPFHVYLQRKTGFSKILSWFSR